MDYIEGCQHRAVIKAWLSKLTGVNESWGQATLEYIEHLEALLADYEREQPLNPTIQLAGEAIIKTMEVIKKYEAEKRLRR